jgi:hypothetical protein
MTKVNSARLYRYDSCTTSRCRYSLWTPETIPSKQTKTNSGFNVIATYVKENLTRILIELYWLLCQGTIEKTTGKINKIKGGCIIFVLTLSMWPNCKDEIKRFFKTRYVTDLALNLSWHYLL